MNVMPNLTADEYERLREDIRQRGILDAVIYDERDRVLDGHNRVAIADELGIEFPKQVLDLGDATDADRDQVAATLNVNRRQLRPDERRELAIRFRLHGVPRKEVSTLTGLAERTITAYSARPVGEDRKRRAEEARALVEAGASQNEAAKTVGLPESTLRRVRQNGTSADSARSSSRPAPLRRVRPIPGWSRQFSKWCRTSSRPEDRLFLQRLDRELHAALDRNGIECEREQTK